MDIPVRVSARARASDEKERVPRHEKTLRDAPERGKPCVETGRVCDFGKTRLSRTHSTQTSRFFSRPSLSKAWRAPPWNARGVLPRTPSRRVESAGARLRSGTSRCGRRRWRRWSAPPESALDSKHPREGERGSARLSRVRDGARRGAASPSRAKPREVASPVTAAPRDKTQAQPKKRPKAPAPTEPPERVRARARGAHREEQADAPSTPRRVQRRRARGVRGGRFEENETRILSGGGGSRIQETREEHERVRGARARAEHARDA